jgi:hypothetical protein
MSAYMIAAQSSAPRKKIDGVTVSPLGGVSLARRSLLLVEGKGPKVDRVGLERPVPSYGNRRFEPLSLGSVSLGEFASRWSV